MIASQVRGHTMVNNAHRWPQSSINAAVQASLHPPPPPGRGEARRDAAEESFPQSSAPRRTAARGRGSARWFPAAHYRLVFIFPLASKTPRMDNFKTSEVSRRRLERRDKAEVNGVHYLTVDLSK